MKCARGHEVPDVEFENGFWCGDCHAYLDTIETQVQEEPIRAEELKQDLDELGKIITNYDLDPDERHCKTMDALKRIRDKHNL